MLLWFFWIIVLITAYVFIKEWRTGFNKRRSSVKRRRSRRLRKKTSSVLRTKGEKNTVNRKNGTDKAQKANVRKKTKIHDE